MSLCQANGIFSYAGFGITESTLNQGGLEALQPVQSPQSVQPS